VKKLLLICAVIAVVTSLVLVGCAPKPAPAGEIVVGVVAPLTGMFAGFAEGILFGIQAAVEDINKLGGVNVGGTMMKIKLVVVDYESDPAKAGALAEDVILRSKVQFIVHGIEPPHVRAPIAVKCEAHKVPHVTGVGPFEAWMGLRAEAPVPWTYTWAISFAIATPAPPGDFRHGKIGYNMMDSWTSALKEIEPLTNKKVAALASDEPDGRGWYLAFSPVLKEMGWEVYKVEQRFGLVPLETIDFSPLIKEWKDADCETLWANCPAPWFGVFWKQAYAMGFKPKMVYATRAGLFYSDVFAWGPDLVHGISNEMFWNPAIKDSPGIGGTTPQSFADRWVKEKKQPYSQVMGSSYAAVQVLIDALQRAGSTEPEKVNAALAKTDLMTIYHRVVFDKDQFSRVPVGFGQWIKVDKPWQLENPIVISQHDFMPIMAPLLFPIPYE